MKRKLALLLAGTIITASAIAFAASGGSRSDSDCPLRGTPACPEYPICCK